MASTRSISATASAAVHTAFLITLVLVLRMSKDVPRINEAATLIPQHLVWLPHDAIGGGRDSGGERAATPPRQSRAIGRDTISVAATPQPSPSESSTIEPPETPTALPALPMGDATQALAGVIESSGTSAGPGDGGAGTSPGSNTGGLGQQPADGFGAGVSRGGPGMTMPELIERVAPKYTADAMRARIQGSVWLECIVLSDGSVGDVRVMRSLDRRFGLDEEAVAAAKRWRFRPGRLAGKPVPAVISIELMFSVR